MHKKITLEEALKLTEAVFIDVRSPKEFAEGKICGAVNIPLLDDDERAIVGTAYKKEGSESAKEQGLSLISARLPEMIKQIKDVCRGKNEVVIYCWRGGMRSKSVVDLLDIVGIKARQLEGGYKRYRRCILDRLQNFDLKPELIVLCGSTGTGKTSILKLLAEKKIPVLNLEELANHRGSIFGNIGLDKAVSAQNFDQALLNILDKLNNEPYIILECESKRIGNVYLPDFLYQTMKKSKRILLSAAIDIRISRLMEEYLDICQDNKEQIAAKAEMLRAKLGNKKTDYLLALLTGDNNNIREAVKILLTDYYDPLYGYEKYKKADNSSFERHITANDLREAADEIAEYINGLNKLNG